MEWQLVQQHDNDQTWTPVCGKRRKRIPLGEAQLENSTPLPSSTMHRVMMTPVLNLISHLPSMKMLPCTTKWLMALLGSVSPPERHAIVHQFLLEHSIGLELGTLLLNHSVYSRVHGQDQPMAIHVSFVLFTRIIIEEKKHSCTSYMYMYMYVLQQIEISKQEDGFAQLWPCYFKSEMGNCRCIPMYQFPYTHSHSLMNIQQAYLLLATREIIPLPAQANLTTRDGTCTMHVQWLTCLHCSSLLILMCWERSSLEAKWAAHED